MVNKKRLVEEFCNLVKIDSLSFQERKIADQLIHTLIELGFQVTEDHCGEIYSGNCGNIYGFLEGNLEGEPLLFSAHMDTVGPGINKTAIVHEDGMITSDGNTVLGADDISGIVAILEAVRVIKENGLPHRSIEVLFTIAEEVYIRGSEVFDYSIIKSKEAYVLDLCGPVGTVALAAPTLLSFTAKIHGKASHAGFAPEEGINAIAITAKVINMIQQGRIDDETTVNIGMIEGGEARNIVSERCILKGEVRSMRHEKADLEIRKIETVLSELASEYRANYEFETEIGCLAYKINEDHAVVTRYRKVCRDLGYEIFYTDTFGGSDNNNFVKNGIAGIVLACGMNQVHSCEEYTQVEELVKITNMVIGLISGKE